MFTQPNVDTSDVTALNEPSREHKRAQNKYLVSAGFSADHTSQTRKKRFGTDYLMGIKKNSFGHSQFNTVI